MIDLPSPAMRWPTQLWGRVISEQEPLGWQLSLILALVVLVVTWSPPGHRLVRHLVTLVHEAGHAVVAALVGRRLQGVRLHADTSGLTVSRGRPDGPGMIATLLAGYPAPALAGLVGALLLGAGHAAAVLWALVLISALMLLLVRNLYGLWVVLALGGAVGALSWWASGPMLSAAAQLVVWALLLSAPRAVVELQRQRRRTRGSDSDADQLAWLTGIPAAVWVGLFWLVCAAALAAAAWQLLEGVPWPWG
ncbi:M50 family metallopeptidase [Nesterenkonia sp. HG001]|uniref:M50 family metallopeptidase n=1 Tax=Nesterenkonia sp. HG001 TaxID=2983207 RepID=UPI002AC6A3C0|nr:M50 family metallopeptidase [Nesterenkonia sp. HG001]MDZ5076367.1 M50 family metallopeptidase [Nesterenkonia sp. HG001]